MRNYQLSLWQIFETIQKWNIEYETGWCIYLKVYENKNISGFEFIWIFRFSLDVVQS